MAARWSGASWGQPTGHDLLELLGRHAGMSRHRHFKQGVLAASQRRFHVAFEHRCERLPCLPLRVLGRKFFDSVKDKEGLEVHRLFSPQAAVVVERGDTLVRRNKIGGVLLRHFLDKSDDGFFGLAVVPGRQRVSGMSIVGGDCQHPNERDRETERENFHSWAFG